MVYNLLYKLPITYNMLINFHAKEHARLLKKMPNWGLVRFYCMSP